MIKIINNSSQTNFLNKPKESMTKNYFLFKENFKLTY